MRYIVIPILIFFWGLWTRRALKEFRTENKEAGLAEAAWITTHGMALLVGLVIGGSHLLEFIVKHW